MTVPQHKTAVDPADAGFSDSPILKAFRPGHGDPTHLDCKEQDIEGNGQYLLTQDLGTNLKHGQVYWILLSLVHLLRLSTP